MAYGTLNVRTDVNACDWTLGRGGGRTDTLRESALKDDWDKKKIPCRTGESNLRRLCAGPMLYQQSYIPASPGKMDRLLWNQTIFQISHFPDCLHAQ